MTVPISEATIRHYATATSFSHGEEYYNRGSVVDLVQRGNVIAVRVQVDDIQFVA